jgi:hypothetical protein
VWGRRCLPGTRRRREGEVNGASHGRLREEEGEGRKREGNKKGKRKKEKKEKKERKEKGRKKKKGRRKRKEGMKM